MARFAQQGDRADVTVVIVSYNSASFVEGLLDDLRREAEWTALRVVVVDNDSTDDTLSVVHALDDVLAISASGNLGYAGAINLGLEQVGPGEDVLVLNPDLRLTVGAVRRMRRRLRESGAGIVVPRVLDPDGTTSPSLRREPTLLRVLGDSLLGARVPGRPGWSSETVWDADAYESAHEVDWATGAALMVRADVARGTGRWDERYFLYSEETDYFRRVRAGGDTVWFEPDAQVMHVGGGSGQSDALLALLTVNKVRYAEATRPAGYAAAVRGVVVLACLLRLHRPGYRRALGLLLDRHRWASLPSPTRSGVVLDLTTFPQGSVVIPAHNEAAVIERTLTPLLEPARLGRIEVVVVCNGCTDDTAELVRRHPEVRLVEIAEPSKTAALDAGDSAVRRWPRLYLDADIDVPPTALAAVLTHLSQAGALAARPPFRYDSTGASWVVRRYYAARLRMPSTQNALWGAGVYGMSSSGRSRFETFPRVTGDDYFVDALFPASDKQVVDTLPVTVRTPRDLAGLMAILRRHYRGNDELLRSGDLQALRPTGTSTGRDLARSVRSVPAAVDAAVYAGLAVVGRVAARRVAGPGWDRDHSSRLGDAGDLPSSARQRERRSADS